MRMNKPFKLVLALILGIILFSSANLNTIDAKTKEIEDYVLFEETITLTNETTQFDIGFVRVTFRKDFIDEDMYPITFTAKLYAENGELFIEFDPDIDLFLKDVTIHVFHYEGFIFDQGTGEFIYVEVPNMVFKVSHFSRWRFIR